MTSAPSNEPPAKRPADPSETTPSGPSAGPSRPAALTPATSRLLNRMVRELRAGNPRMLLWLSDRQRRRTSEGAAPVASLNQVLADLSPEEMREFAALGDVPPRA